MMKRNLLIMVAVLCCTLLTAKTPERPDSYNYQRGIELVENENFEEGIEYLIKELENNPKNGYAQAWLASAFSQLDERGKTIYYLEEAQKNLPKAEKYYRAWTYSLRATIYLEMQDTTNALRSYATAIKVQPTNTDWYNNRGRLYRELEQWEASDADFQRCINLAPTSIRGYLYLAYNLYLQERYEEALKKNQYAHQLAERAYTYSAMAECEVKLEQWEEAVDHIIQALEMEAYESTATDLLEECKHPEFIHLMQTALKAQTMKYPNAVEWLLYQTFFFRSNHQYTAAILAAKKARSISPDPTLDELVSKAYRYFGDWENALVYANMAIEGDSTDNSLIENRAKIYNELGDTTAMMEDLNELVKRLPESYKSFSLRADNLFFNGQYERAIADYDIALTMEKDLNWSRYLRARALAYTGDTAKAKKEYERIVKNNQSELAVIFALASLGEKDQALQKINKLMQKDSLDNRYDKACILALVGEKEQAMKEIEQALKEGYAEFRHLRLDPDFMSLHGEEFDQLINQYEQECKQRVSTFQLQQKETEGEERIVEIPFTAANGVTKVDCTVNGLPLNFIFDTGASDVTLSLTEANFMFKNGYLKAKDIVGKQTYQTADGSISVGTVFIIEHINFGGLELTNVQASVVLNQKAPLLLGQTVLKRLGKIEIDNEKRILRITTK